MNSPRPTLPTPSDNERTPLIDSLLEFIQWQMERMADLEDEIQSLKKETKKPRFRSGDMDK